jgi:predicted nucleic acid-binding protein
LIVVDANILFPYVFDVADRPLVLKVWKQDPLWHLPALWRYELTNTLLKYVRAGRCSETTAEQALGQALQIAGPREGDVNEHAVLRTALSLEISAYDATYVALAQRMGIQLVTLDKALATKAKGVAVLAGEFVS